MLQLARVSGLRGGTFVGRILWRLRLGLLTKALVDFEIGVEVLEPVE